jgi:hypothetical protein
MGLWWFCFIQWPLFMLWGLAGGIKFFTFSAKSLANQSLVDQLEGYYVAYMISFAPYLILPVALTAALVIRRQKGKRISKLEKWLAIGSWVLSLLVSAVVGIQGDFRT